MPRINGNNRNNTLTGTNGSDTIDGRGGNDRIDGGLGNDFMFGGAGDDFIISNAGNDVMTGGSGADVFAIGPRSSGRITITDFEDGVDRIDLTQFGFNAQGESASWAGFLSTEGADTIIQMYGVNGEFFEIELQNFPYWQIDPSDYILFT